MLYIPLNPAFFLLLFNLWFFFYFKRLYPEKIISEKEPDTPHTPKRFYPLPQKGTGYQILRKDLTPKNHSPEKTPLTPKNLSPNNTFPENISPLFPYSRKTVFLYPVSFTVSCTPRRDSPLTPKGYKTW